MLCGTIVLKSEKAYVYDIKILNLIFLTQVSLKKNLSYAEIMPTTSSDRYWSRIEYVLRNCFTIQAPEPYPRDPALHNDHQSLDLI